MRLLMLPRYGPLGASSRVRMYQYIPMLQQSGVEVTVSPLFGDDYVRALYAGKRAITAILGGYVRRIARLARGGAFEVVWIEKELLPWLPASADSIRGRALLALDYDDAVFHRYDQHANALVRRFLGRRIDKVMAGADLVTSGNDYLSERARRAGCPQVEALPTVVDLQRYAMRTPDGGSGGPLRIGWIGSPATAHYLHRVAPAIARLAQSHAIEAVAVGARPDQVLNTPFRAVPWAEDSEASQVASFDIGIMPLPDEPWERGKCGYKLIQYMACGLPVVASAVGVNKEIVVPGQHGLLVEDDAQWFECLQQLIRDPQGRQRMGRAGRERVEQWYSLQAQAPRLVAMLEGLARRGR